MKFDPAAIINNDMSFNDLQKKFPAEWQLVKRELSEMIKTGEMNLLNDHLLKTKERYDLLIKKNVWTDIKLCSQLVMTKLTFMGIDVYLRSTLEHSQPLSKRDLLLAQNLFFNRKMQRRLLSSRLFNFIWTFVKNKSSVLSLVQRQGIYSIYSKETIRQIQFLVAEKKCLEIAAGDGFLTQMLAKSGVKIIATDDKSWQHKVQSPEWVEHLTAEQAMEKYQCPVVLCSWPPPGNKFEEKIFSQPFVETYIVILSQHEFAAGNFVVYRQQKHFSMERCEILSASLLPFEAEQQALVFRRKP